MINHFILQLLLSVSDNKPLVIRVSGTSMYPSIHNGDKIQISRSDSYVTGDIVVFMYKENEPLVHRLVKIKGNTFYCKGDNTFRLEDITREQILGKVVSVNGVAPLLWTQELIDLSYQVNREFIKTRNIIDVQNTKTFYQYQKALHLLYNY